MKKIIYSIIVLVVILVGIFLVINFKPNNTPNIVTVFPKDDSVKIGNVLNNSVSVKNCELYRDFDTVVKSKDLKKCDCLDSTQKETCRSYVSDVMYYEQAYAQADVSICNNISSETSKTACIKIVNEMVASQKKAGSDNLLQTYIFSGDYDKAIAILEQKIKTEQKNIKYLNYLAQAYASKALAERQETVYIPKALALTEKAKTIEPNNPEIYKTEGYIYEVKPDLNKAVASYDKAISLNADYITAYTGRGHAQEMLGNTLAALADFSKAATLDKDQKYMYTFSNLCRLDFYLKKYDDSIKNCNIVMASELSTPISKSEAAQILASAYSSIGKYDDAWTQFKTAESYTPDDASLMISIASMLLKKGGEAVQAETYSRKAVTLDPKRAIAHEKLAASLMSQGKHDEAISSAEKALSLIPNDVSILQNYKNNVILRIYSILLQVYIQTGDKVSQSKYQALIDSLNI